MLRVFLVSVGVSLTEDLPPTANVATLQQSLGQQCGVSSKDVILLTAKGHLLESAEIVGSYDGGTEERPFFVYFRPGVNPKTSYVEPSFKRNTRLEQAMYSLTAAPSPSTLQQQTSLAKEFAQEGIELVHCFQQMYTQTHLLWCGWEALLFNFLSMQRTFEKRQRNFDSALRNFTESKDGYKKLLEKTPEQLEILKKVVLPSFMSRSVFGSETHSLYNWINLQDERSSLEDLLKECGQALIQVNEETIDELQQTANKLSVSSAELYQKETQNVLQLENKDLENICTEQKSTAQSLHATVRKALGSGDAGTLASISLSNCQLLKLMYTNHQKLESCVSELYRTKTVMKERIATGLKSLAKLQQHMTEVDTKIQFQCGQMQLMRRKFEVLEQVCAAPDMMICVLNEIQQRKVFKQFFVKEGERVKQKFEELRQREKNRRQRFLEKCGQHFVLSLFPSLTDRLPHFITSVPQKFDDEICLLPTEEINQLLQVFPLPVDFENNNNDCLLSCDGSTQTDNNDNNQPLTNDSCIQTSIYDRRTHSQLTKTETQTTSINSEILTDVPLIDSSSQTVLHRVMDNSTHMEPILYHDMCTQYESMAKDSVSLQTELEGIQNELRIYTQGLDIAVQASVDYRNTCIQVSPQFQTLGTQSDTHVMNTKMNTDLVEKSIQTHSHTTATSVHTQTVIFTNHVLSQTQPIVSDIHTQTNNTILRPILIDISSQTQADVSDIHTQTNNTILRPILIDISSQTQADVSDTSSQTQSHILTNTYTQTDHIWHQLTNKGIDDLEGQVVALKAAVEGLQNQLMSEREEHTKRQLELQRGWRHMRRSLHDSQEMPQVVSITNLKVGDSALFLQDTRGNFLALSFDDRIYYLSHTSAEKLLEDISSKSYVPLKRKVFYGYITEKVLVQVQKERNRLEVPVGQRLYKLSAQEMPLY